jgi:predicted phage gp36 major capsid-like protein
MKKYLVAAGIVTAASVAGLTGYAAVNAATDTNSTNPMSSLVSAIAKKFNLQTSDVQAVFDEQRSSMEAERETKVKEEVAQLVTDGKLTQAQADTINAKRAELQKERAANRSSDQSMTEAQRKAKMDERKTALDTWLKNNTIDAQYAYLLMGGHGHGGPGGPGMREEK